jgi:hypothetical protein
MNNAKHRHEQLLRIVPTYPEDTAPWGTTKYDKLKGDCSWGCKHFIPLEGAIGLDWGVCVNEKSHRCGQLTFEHMMCDYIEIVEDRD